MQHGEKRECPVCGFPIYGKKGKVFCSDGCRNTYYNRKMKDTYSVIRDINGILKKNYRILHRCIHHNTLQIDQNTLLNEGFNFNFSTSTKRVQGENWILCYDIGYRLINEATIQIQSFNTSFNKNKKT
jgi:predicted nucleic acid-binding Zn ribbon protein